MFINPERPLILAILLLTVAAGRDFAPALVRSPALTLPPALGIIRRRMRSAGSGFT